MTTVGYREILIAISILFFTTSSSLGGMLCNKGTTASQQQVVVANLENGAKDHSTTTPMLETDSQSTDLRNFEQSSKLPQ